ncbi:hypothetical protein P7C70_g6066, partial [Phenoliferia sp. Uapishka_3]
MTTQTSFQPRPLVPGSGLAGPSHLWNAPPPANGQQANGNANSSGAGGAGGGLQLPSKAGPSIPAVPVSTPGTPAANAPAARPVAKQASPGAPEAPEARQTDVDALMDAVGISGVDIGAEEESMRQANVAAHQTVQPVQPGQDRSRKQDFIDPNVLAECVKKIAAAFQLRTLEPDTIPLIALATRHRLMSLINDAVAARDHRLSASHLRPPPLTTKKRRRGAGSDGEDEDGEDDDDDEDEDFDDFDGGVAKRRARAAAKGKSREGEPAWDVVVYDDPEKILGVLERVDREEERKRRRERMLRDQKEEEERALEDAIKASEEAQQAFEGPSSTSIDHLVMGAGGGASGASGSGPATPKGDETPGSKDKKPKRERKKKKETAANPRNLSEDVKKRLTDQVTSRQIGGRSYSWLNSGGGVGSSSTGFSSPTPGALPKPKFAPASSLPPPNFGSPLATGGFGAAGGSATGGSHLPSALGRLSNVPPLHDANRARAAKEEWERGQHIVEIGDVVFALERERGMGVGKGTGRNVLLRSRAGLGPRSNPPGGVGK